MEFGMYINNNLVMVVKGMDNAYDIWSHIEEAADLNGEYAAMVDMRTGEIIADNDDDDDIFTDDIDLDDVLWWLLG